MIPPLLSSGIRFPSAGKPSLSSLRQGLPLRRAAEVKFPKSLRQPGSSPHCPSTCPYSVIGFILGGVLVCIPSLWAGMLSPHGVLGKGSKRTQPLNWVPLHPALSGWRPVKQSWFGRGVLPSPYRGSLPRPQCPVSRDHIRGWRGREMLN